MWSSVFSILVSAAIGRRPLGLEVTNQRIEADLRRNLVLLEAAPQGVYQPVDEDKPTEDEEIFPTPRLPCCRSKVSTHLDAASPQLLKPVQKLSGSIFADLFDQFLIILPFFRGAVLLFAPPEKGWLWAH